MHLGEMVTSTELKRTLIDFSRDRISTFYSEKQCTETQGTAILALL